MQEAHTALGIDVGGSGIKGALVDVRTGELVSQRVRLDTPQPATPAAMAATFAALARQFDWEGPIGCGFPAIIRGGVALSASNIHPSWVGYNANELFSQALGCPVHLLNDADAAGISALQFGLAKGQQGTVLLITLGTGIGSALFHGGVMVPNTEFGHIYLPNQAEIAERYCADSVRKRENLSWEEWGGRLNRYLLHLEFVLQPDLIILGGGGCKKFEEYQQYLTLATPVKAAILQNNGGIIGAAYYAWHAKKG